VTVEIPKDNKIFIVFINLEGHRPIICQSETNQLSKSTNRTTNLNLVILCSSTKECEGFKALKRGVVVLARQKSRLLTMKTLPFQGRSRVTWIALPFEKPIFSCMVTMSDFSNCATSLP
jgi:hypothetical protein